MNNQPDYPERLYPIHLHVPGVLRLLSEHLYSTPKTALRELIQNAYDSCQRRLVDDPLVPSDYRPQINISIDPTNRQLTISDNGSGLTENEIHEYLSTVGRGYTSELRERLEFSDHEEAKNLIGQFGLGLLAAFLVAERLEISTRSFQPGSMACRWESSGDATYSLGASSRREIGTAFTLHLKLEGEFLLNERLTREAIRIYANYLPIPITLNGDKLAVNAMNAPWHEDASDETYRSFLVEHTEWQSPLSILPLKDLIEPITLPDGTQDELHLPLCGALVVPASSALSNAEYGTVSVYIRRMHITDTERDLLPRWARFVGGIIESPVLVPTASREHIRHDETYFSIQNGLEAQLLAHFQTLAVEQPEVWRQILRTHNDLIKGWSLESPELFWIIADLVTFPTSAGERTLPEIIEECDGTITYLTDIRDIMPVRLLYQAHGIVVVDASGFADEAFLKQYAARRTKIRLQVLDQMASKMLAPVDDEYHYQPIVDYFASQSIAAQIVRFATPEVPGLLVYPTSSRDKDLQSYDEDRLEDSVAYLVNEFVRLHPASSRGTEVLCLNAFSPLLGRLMDVDPDAPQWAATLDVIYRSAQLFSGRLRTPAEMSEVFSLLTFSLNQLLGPDPEPTGA